MAKLYNRAGVVTTTAGTGTITLGSAIASGTSINSASFRDFASAGVANSDTVSYLILDSNGAWEYGTGTYTSAGTTLSRTLGASSTGSLLNLSGSAQVFVTARSEDLLSASETQTANKVLAGPTSGGAAVPAFRSLVMADLPSLSQISATLGANVTLNNTASFFDGPSIAQGSTGTWFVSGTVSLQDSSAAARFDAKLWDGTTIVATATNTSGGASFVAAIALSGFITSPAGNLRISVKDASSTNGSIMAVSGGIGGSNISAFRIA